MEGKRRAERRRRASRLRVDSGQQRHALELSGDDNRDEHRPPTTSVDSKKSFGKCTVILSSRANSRCSLRVSASILFTKVMR